MSFRQVILHGIGVIASLSIGLAFADSAPLFAKDSLIVAQSDSSGSRRRLPRGRSRSIPETPTNAGTGTESTPTDSDAPNSQSAEPSVSTLEESPKTPTVEVEPMESTPVPTTQPQEVAPSQTLEPVPMQEVDTPASITKPEITPPTEVERDSLEQAPVEPTTQPQVVAPPQTLEPSNVEEVDIQPAERRLPSGRSRSTVERPGPQREKATDQPPSQAQIDEFQRSNFLPIQDRWRIGYADNQLDPYAQNVLKGDYAILGQNIFLNVIGISESLFEARNVPTPQGISRNRAGTGEFFGRGRQLFFNQNLVASIELFQGSTGFKPRDWAFRATPVFNYNYLNVEEQNIVNLDPREGTTRNDNQVAFQELFVEVRLLDISPRFDFISTRIGIQGFTSDFRGFIFADNEPGIRFFGNFLNNRYQWNVAVFNLLEKDTNSMLNSFEWRHRQVVIANIYKQDFIFKGYTTQFSFHYDRDVAGDKDSGGQQFDQNGFIVRPARLGTLRPHNVHAYYLGWTGEGHIGRWNVSHAFYQVFGKSTFDPVAGQEVDINAQLAALEISYDIDWWRPKVSVFYASGDRNPVDDVARGFDSILDNVNFAGNGFSYYNRQGFLLSATGVFLNNRFSFLNDLRSSKIQGQSQFTNPGVILANAGIDIEATPKLKVLLNYNYLWFASTASLEFVLHREELRQSIGHDASFGFIYRPLLNQNIVLNGGLAYLFPTGGLKDIQGDKGLYSGFFSIALTF